MKTAARQESAPDPRFSRKAYEIRPPFKIDDALTFGPDGAAARTRLAGLEGPSRDAVCFDEAAALWACGLQGRAALHNIVAKSPVRCTPAGPTEAAVPASCTVDGLDLGRELVRLGFARAATGTSADQDEARRAGRGLWRGGWKVRP